MLLLVAPLFARGDIIITLGDARARLRKLLLLVGKVRQLLFDIVLLLAERTHGRNWGRIAVEVLSDAVSIQAVSLLAFKLLKLLNRNVLIVQYRVNRRCIICFDFGSG